MTRRAQRGFALPAAIFLVVVLALLGAVMVSMSTTQQINAVRDTAGSRAYFAARTGLEWGAYQVLQNAGTCNASAALPNATTATGFAVQVNCTLVGTYDEAGTSFSVYQLTSTASTGTLGRHDYIERQVQAVLSR